MPELKLTGMDGYNRLMEAVKKDCNEPGCCGCFNPDGCDKHNQRVGTYGNPDFRWCHHSYCDKFAWTINQAKHYAEVTGLNWTDVLNAWEEDRDYWYMNYYQECNQPKISGNNVRMYETPEDFRMEVEKDGFYCPNCRRVTKHPFCCDNEGCDWKSYGLFRNGTVLVFFRKQCKFIRVFEPVLWRQQRNARPDNISDIALKCLRNEFPEGTRVELVKMDDPYNKKLVPGERGTVKTVDDLGTIHVAWDCGSGLGVVYGVDECRKVVSSKT